jgi:hypothetical protein
VRIRIGARDVEVLDGLCAFRSCLWVGEWKGVLTPGRGYTYASRDTWHLQCHRRGTHGCPHPLPEPDPEAARCCHAPRVRSSKPDAYGRQPKRQRCTTCGAWLTGFALACVRADRIPEKPAPYPCEHGAAVASLARPGWYECNSWDGGCRGAWNHKPEPGEHPQATFDDLYTPKEPTP